MGQQRDASWHKKHMKRLMKDKERRKNSTHETRTARFWSVQAELDYKKAKMRETEFEYKKPTLLQRITSKFKGYANAQA